YDKAIALKPSYAEAYNNRGAALSELERHEEALATCDKAVAFKPDYAEAYYNRGNALKNLRRHEEALASYDRAVALKPNHAETLINRGNVLIELRALEEAQASYNRAIALLIEAPEASRAALAAILPSDHPAIRELPSDHPAIREVTQVSFSRLQMAVDNMIEEVVGGKRDFALTEDYILGLHRLAMDGLLEKPGGYRKRHVWIMGSQHLPP